MPHPLLGAHMPVAGGLGNALRNGKAIGCETVQVFTSSPQQWRAKEVTEAMVEDFRRAREETGISQVVSHDSYLVNLCAPDPAKRRQSIGGLVAELGRCAQYGIRFVVSHMGAHVGQGEECGLQGVAESMREVLAETDPSVTICMETTAGQGSSLNARFEGLAWLIEASQGHDRVAVCLDTCHVFAAGYDLRTREAYEATMAEFDRLIGLDRLKVVHCNDSKKPLGSRVDRHAHLGEGEIGEEAFRLLVNDPRLSGVPVLVETPMDDVADHERNIARLRSFIV